MLQQIEQVEDVRRRLGGLGIRPLHALLSMLILLIGLVPLFLAVRSHGQRVDRAEAAVMAFESALRRAQAIMAMPQNAARSVQLGWRSADRMWRQAGDTASDYNHYTKRATLGAIYAATLAVFAGDQSEDHADTRAFLERRIDGIMKFEKAKAKWLNPDREHFSPARLLGRLRYPAR